MMLSYPASGVGVGGFIIEFPNYNTVEQSLRFHTDSAENYVLQAGAEMGLWGAGLALWILIELLRLILRGRRPREREDSLRFIRFGIRAGLAAVLVNLLFHSYIGAFDAKYLLWLLAGLLAGLNRLERPGERDRPISRGFITAAVLVGLIYGGNLLWHSTHSLSLPRSAERHGFSQNFGLYQTEQDNQGRSFSWSKKTAGLTFPNTGGKLRLPIRASHPGIEKYPVTVTVYQADAYFRKQRRLEDLKLDHSRWKEYTLTLSGFEGPQLFLIFEVSRLWQPQKYLGSSDTRWLGIAIGEPH